MPVEPRASGLDSAGMCRAAPILVCVLGIWASAGNAASISFTVDPPQPSYEVGDTITVQMSIDPQGDTETGLYARLRFDPRVLHGVSASQPALTASGVAWTRGALPCAGTFGLCDLINTIGGSSAAAIDQNPIVSTVVLEVIGPGTTPLLVEALPSTFHDNLFGLAMPSPVATISVAPEPLPLVELRWVSTTGTGTSGDDDIAAGVGDVLTLGVRAVPSNGLTFSGLSFAFDPAVLQALSAQECPDASLVPGSPNPSLGVCSDPTTGAILTPLAPGETLDNTGGRVGLLDAATTTPVAEGPVDVAAIRFQVVSTPVVSEVSSAFSPGIQSVNDGSGFARYPAVSARVVPEPGRVAGLLAGFGLCLVLARRAGRAGRAAAVLALAWLALATPLRAVAQAVDTDHDGVPDSADNCTLLPNGPPLDCDVDGDGYGNLCDGDYDDDFDVDSAELALFAGALESTGPSEMDHDCDQVVGGPDYGWFLSQLNAGQPGPSGLLCAGTPPCP